MNIDERLDRLTMIVERRSQEQDKHKKTGSRRVINSSPAPSNRIARTNRRLANLMVKMNDEQARQSAEQLRIGAGQQQGRQEFRNAMMRLLNIAEAHQDTLDNRERRLGGAP